MAVAASETPIDLVIRFSTANPDIIVAVPAPSKTSTLTLKRQIRACLETPAAECRLRLIHAGKVLPEAAALSNSLNVTLQPPPRDNDDDKSAKAKGKQPVRAANPATAAARVYIHCSIGDTLSEATLALEAKQASDADHALLSYSSTPTAPALGTSHSANEDGDATTTTPAPRGFDRLLNAGFTAVEVAQLRSQFLAIQSHAHTPDSMPSGPALLALEERWLDSGSNPATGGGEEGTTAGGFISEDAGGLEDMLYGNLIGFFWPMGAMFWLMREEGVWSRRKQIAVLSGFLVNVTFGFLRVMN
ncbi:hypothetical protein B0A50_01020 [Salinomyces thailandicus]|uniref:Ubiquitin-like domain-containing protein n=1 Tax=Salinomyces thailandicus TaxID=706561 RepID=A0A4U0UEJ2_9PEZI|nr:hypothetical protein B0A50_01020 [Salinomyces thailandica]